MLFLPIATIAVSFAQLSLTLAHSVELEDMLIANEGFQFDRLRRDPDFFTKLYASQSPKVLWISCSDSRETPEILTRSDIGEIFTLRNIAGCVNKDDYAAKSAIQFAIQELKVLDIVVVGHTNCGGISAALNYDTLTGDLIPYIRPIYDTYIQNKAEIDAIEDKGAKNAALSMLNIQRNVENVNNLESYQQALKGGAKININGFLFRLETGLLQNLYLNRTNF